MKNRSLLLLLLLLPLIIAYSCSGQEKNQSSTTNQEINPFTFLPNLKSAPQIAEYIRNIYQDKNGHLWFGTNGYGVAHYNGDSIRYYSNAQGFEGQQITGMTEDRENNIWFATDQGIVKYEWSSSKGEKRFTNFSDIKHFNKQRFWSVYADSKNNIWAGSESGLFVYNDKVWKPFEVPYPEKITGEFITKATTWGITEDQAGNMWFSTNGFGAFEYDGQSFTQYSTKDGMRGNDVDDIIEDSKGNIWFATRYGGVSRYDGVSFNNHPSIDSIGNQEVCVIYEDSDEHIWFSAEGYGVYKFDGKSVINYGIEQGLKVQAVQTIFEDREGRLWVGGGGGLYRFEDGIFYNVTKEGPWD